MTIHRYSQLIYFAILHFFTCLLSVGLCVGKFFVCHLEFCVEHLRRRPHLSITHRISKNRRSLNQTEQQTIKGNRADCDYSLQFFIPATNVHSLNRIG